MYPVGRLRRVSAGYQSAHDLRNIISPEREGRIMLGLVYIADLSILLEPCNTNLCENSILTTLQIRKENLHASGSS